jgi:flagellar protein FlaJ
VPKNKDSSDRPEPASGITPALAQIKGRFMLDLDASQFDLLTVLTYLSSVSTANLDRAQLFEAAAKLGYAPSPYFARVSNLVKSMSYDYPHACYVVARRADDEVMRQFLLRFGNSMASGEEEVVFLARETRVIMEDYTNEYERAVESLRKWTDAYVALMVSANLVVLVALISNMIYSLGTSFILMAEGVSITSSALGAYLLYRIAPYDPVVHKLEHKSAEQRLLRRLATFLLPGSLTLGLLAFMGTGSIGLGLIVAGFVIAPVGFITHLLERKVDARDRDIADFVRALGGVTAARGSTVIDSLDHIDRRAIGSLEPELKRLLTRVHAGIDTTLSWGRFMAETGSELVHRVVRSFSDGNDWGGEADKIGNFAADMALRVWLLRAKRKLVSTTFTYVVIPMHIALTGTLVFMSEVVSAFNVQLVQAQSALDSEAATSVTTPEELGLPSALAFQGFDTSFVKLMVLLVVFALTAINAFAPRAASGGHAFKMAMSGSITLIASGVVLMVIPPMAAGLFSDTVAAPAH